MLIDAYEEMSRWNLEDCTSGETDKQTVQIGGGMNKQMGVHLNDAGLNNR